MRVLAWRHARATPRGCDASGDVMPGCACVRRGGCESACACVTKRAMYVRVVRIQGSRPGIMLTCIVSFMAITPIVSEREGLH